MVKLSTSDADMRTPIACITEMPATSLTENEMPISQVAFDLARVTQKTRKREGDEGVGRKERGAVSVE